MTEAEGSYCYGDSKPVEKTCKKAITREKAIGKDMGGFLCMA